MRHARDTDLPLTVDRTASTGLGEQLVRQIRELVARGVLRPGDPLPSSRAPGRTSGLEEHRRSQRQHGQRALYRAAFPGAG